MDPCLGELGRGKGDADSVGVVGLMAAFEGSGWTTTSVLGTCKFVLIGGRARESPGMAVTVQDL
jgi:hypothetical protein